MSNEKLITIESLCAQIEEVGRKATNLIDAARRERDEERRKYALLLRGIRGLQTTCCGDSAEPCYGCRMLLSLLPTEQVDLEQIKGEVLEAFAEAKSRG